MRITSGSIEPLTVEIFFGNGSAMLKIEFQVTAKLPSGVDAVARGVTVVNVTSGEDYRVIQSLEKIVANALAEEGTPNVKAPKALNTSDLRR
jgi:hypothetical protein